MSIFLYGFVEPNPSYFPSEKNLFFYQKLLWLGYLERLYDPVLESSYMGAKTQLQKLLKLKIGLLRVFISGHPRQPIL